MNQVAGVIKMHLRGRFNWFILPWLILFFSFATNLCIGILIGGHTTFYSGGVFSLYISAFIVGILVINETFPFALGFSVRRTDYFLGTIATALGVSAITALPLFLFSLVESQLTEGWGLHVHFFSLPYMSDGPFLAPLWTCFVLIVHMYIFGFAISSIYRRFGRSGMYVFFILAFLLVSVCTFLFTYFTRWAAIFHWLLRHPASELAWWLFLLTAIYALIAYILLRKATV